MTVIELIAVVFNPVTLVVAGLVGYFFLLGKTDGQGTGERVKERLQRQHYYRLVEDQAEEQQRHRRLGQEEGRRAALRMIVKDKTQEPSYRTAAARLLKCCPVCSRQCIHCAKEDREHDAA